MHRTNTVVVGSIHYSNGCIASIRSRVVTGSDIIQKYPDSNLDFNGYRYSDSDISRYEYRYFF
jgi:hypothetical protein